MTIINILPSRTTQPEIVTEVVNNNLAYVRTWIEAENKPNTFYYGMGLLDYAIQNGSKETFDYLLEEAKADPNAKAANDKFSAFEAALFSRNHTHGNYFIEKMIANRGSFVQFSPFALSLALQSNATTVKKYIESKDFDLTIRDYLGNNILDYVSGEEIVKYLIEQCPDKDRREFTKTKAHYRKFYPLVDLDSIPSTRKKKRGTDLATVENDPTRRRVDLEEFTTVAAPATVQPVPVPVAAPAPATVQPDVPDNNTFTAIVTQPKKPNDRQR